LVMSGGVPLVARPGNSAAIGFFMPVPGSGS
jgi:hypothetical protein